MRFTWNNTKAAVNVDKHGVSFEEACTCFADPRQIAFFDPDHSDAEERELLIGHSNIGRLLLVSSGTGSYTLEQGITSGQQSCDSGVVTLAQLGSSKLAFTFRRSGAPSPSGTLTKTGS